MYVYTHTHTHMSMCIHTCLCVYVHTQTRIYACVCTYTHRHVCIHIDMCVCVCVYTYMYTYVCVYLYTHRHKYKWQCFWNKYSNFLSWWIRFPKAFRHTQSFKMNSIDVKAQMHVLIRWHLKTQFRLSALLALHLNYANTNGLIYFWRSTPDTLPQFSLLPIPT